MHRVCVFAFRVACTVNLLAPVLIVRLPRNNEIIFKVLIVIVLSLLLELSFFCRCIYNIFYGRNIIYTIWLYYNYKVTIIIKWLPPLLENRYQYKAAKRPLAMIITSTQTSYFSSLPEASDKVSIKSSKYIGHGRTFISSAGHKTRVAIVSANHPAHLNRL